MRLISQRKVTCGQSATPVSPPTRRVFPVICASRAALRNRREIGFPASAHGKGQGRETVTSGIHPKENNRSPTETRPRTRWDGLVGGNSRPRAARGSVGAGFSARDNVRTGGHAPFADGRIAEGEDPRGFRSARSGFAPETQRGMAGQLRRRRRRNTRRHADRPNVLTVSTVGSRAAAAAAVAATMEGMSRRIPRDIRALWWFQRRGCSPRVSLTKRARGTKTTE